MFLSSAVQIFLCACVLSSLTYLITFPLLSLICKNVIKCKHLILNGIYQKGIWGIKLEWFSSVYPATSDRAENQAVLAAVP